MRLFKLFGFQLSGEKNKCDKCKRIRRYRFRRRSISLRSNDDKCFCLYQKYYLMGFPIVHTREEFPNLEQAEDRYLELYDKRLVNKVIR